MTFANKFKPVSLVLLFIICEAKTQKNDGEPCIHEYTNTAGRCEFASNCQTARQDLQQNGIKPTFCTYGFDDPLVCCRDANNILQTTPKFDSRPIWDNSDGQTDNRRISEKKCEEYSRGVTQTVDFLPLLPDPITISISAAKCDYAGVELIVGGENANLGEFPHMAAIGWVNEYGNYSFGCGGSLISPRFVLTAGHCSRDPRAVNPTPAIVRLGDQNIDSTVQDGAYPVEVPIRNIIKHPDYKPPRRYNDIALLELATDVEFENAIRPACLWTRTDVKGYDRALATGWGVTSTRTQETASELQKVSLKLYDSALCDRLLASSRNRNWNGFAPSQLCAGELRGGKDTCQGDSGAPLQVVSKDNQCIFNIIGVTSFGQKCAESGKPAVYTRVSSYIDWIESVVWPRE